MSTFRALFVVVFLTYGGKYLSARMEQNIKYNHDQSSIMILLEHNFKHNAVFLRVTLKVFEHNITDVSNFICVQLLIRNTTRQCCG